MSVMMKTLCVLAVVCGFFVFPDFTSAAVRGSPRGGIQHRTYSSLRQGRSRSYAYRYRSGRRPYTVARRYYYRPYTVARRYYYRPYTVERQDYACPQPEDVAATDVVR